MIFTFQDLIGTVIIEISKLKTSTQCGQLYAITLHLLEETCLTHIKH